ncbi:Glycosyltransferase, GT2 family [Ekhidna lutea]|uniref:Glycosyltransferase, GT2 family n=1 Tax=Ekhidna lutea TaxID=447679 RepID=A0A239FQT9_EKHLU|nr:glycosyltransferase family 2 protein [Ekhidna lutea]SNS59135.1 Glycosyltransferase, GT2 family [Ekhidna lutea]
MDISHSDVGQSERKCCTIIVTYNGEKWIKNCLYTLFSSIYATDIIVIDNGSSDNTVQILEEYLDQIQLIKTGQNLGFGGANNIGIKMALEQGYDYFFLLNQDTWVEPDAIGQLIKGLKQNEMYGILSPVHVNGQMNAFDRNFKKFVRRYKKINLPFNESELARHKSPIDVGFVNAAAWMISRKCIEEVGVFSPLFYHYAEDNNYCHRTLSHGFKIGIIKESLIYHDREYRNDSYSPTKDFERETVKSLSNPLKNRTLLQDFIIALSKILEISSKIRFYKIPGFMFWAFKEFFVLRRKVKEFDNSALYNFELDHKYS